jgi:hypothetical protein
MTHIFLKDVSDDIINLEVSSIDELLLYISNSIRKKIEDIIIFCEENDEEINILEEGKIYNFLVRENIRLLYDCDAYDDIKDKKYNKYTIELCDEYKSFYYSENNGKFYSYQNIDVLDRLSFFENIRFRSYDEGMDLESLLLLYFENEPFYKKKYITNNILKMWEDIENYDCDLDPYEDYEEYYINVNHYH